MVDPLGLSVTDLVLDASDGTDGTRIITITNPTNQPMPWQIDFQPLLWQGEGLDAVYYDGYHPRNK